MAEYGVPVASGQEATCEGYPTSRPEEQHKINHILWDVTGLALESA